MRSFLYLQTGIELNSVRLYLKSSTHKLDPSLRRNYSVSICLSYCKSNSKLNWKIKESTLAISLIFPTKISFNSYILKDSQEKKEH